MVNPEMDVPLLNYYAFWYIRNICRENKERLDTKTIDLQILL